MSERDEYVAGLRALADLLEEHPELEVPDSGKPAEHSRISLCVMERSQMVAWARHLEGVREHTLATGSMHYLTGHLRGINLKLFGSADRMGGASRKVQRQVTEYKVPSVLAEVSS